MTDSLTTGDAVRVKRGVMCVEYADLPMGGWCGTIVAVHDDGLCTVRWSRQTLEAAHPIFAKRCERDGVRLEEYTLNLSCLERDPGGPLDIEHPTEILVEPLSPDDEEDRIRMIFGLTSNDPLPEVDDETLTMYHSYLYGGLSFPFDADYTRETGPFSETTLRLRVTGLGEPDDDLMIDEMYGILCHAVHRGEPMVVPLGDLEVVKRGENRQRIKDYAYWLHNYM